MRKYNSEEFIKKAVEKHNNKYDYSKVKYVNSQTKVCIICPEHGEFWQTPANHLYKTTCPKCSIKEIHDKQKSNKEEFIKKAKEIIPTIELPNFYYQPIIKCLNEKYGIKFKNHSDYFIN